MKERTEYYKELTIMEPHKRNSRDKDYMRGKANAFLFSLNALTLSDEDNPIDLLNYVEKYIKNELKKIGIVPHPLQKLNFKKLGVNNENRS
jgi:hypothetical protein